MLDQIRRNPLFIYIVLYDCLNNFKTILYQFERLYEEAVSFQCICSQFETIVEILLDVEPGKKSLRHIWKVLPTQQWPDVNVI